MNCFLRITLTTVSLFFCAFCFSQVDLTKGLMAYYPFNGNANDASSNGNNTIFNNATLTSDYYGNPNSAYYFNGIDNYMEIANAPSLNMNQTISVCAWIKPEGFYYGPCHGNRIVMKGDDDFLEGNYLLTFDDTYYTQGQNCFTQLPDTIHETFYGRGTDLNPVNDTPFVQKNIWHSLVYTYNGINAKLYVDCQLILTTAANGLSFSNSYNLFLGRMNTSQYPYWFNGVMDEVRIYNRALNADEVKAYSVSCSNSEPCNNWLLTPDNSSFVRVGDLDIPGQAVTIEAVFNRTTPYNGSQVFSGDLVSKHRGPPDVNYLLRPNKAQIHTDNGYFETPDVCDIKLNKTYHVALVYDGVQLKFYRNGFLLQNIPASGNLTQNDWLTQIGYDYSQQPNENFVGYINEVRIWNIARTQKEIKAYMNKPLPNPSSQQGLLAYYTFDNLQNKQGNSQWDGSLFGNAAINQNNPACTDFVADSCASCVKPSVKAGNNVAICRGDSTKLVASGALNYFWQPSAYLSADTIPDPVAFPVSTIDYVVTGYTAPDCFARDTVNVLVHPLPPVYAGINFSICSGDSVQLNASGAAFYSWNDSVTLSDNHIYNPVAQPLQTTNYIVTGTDNFSCRASDTVMVAVLYLPSVYAGRDTSVCGNNKSVQLSASGAASYVWSPLTGLSDANIYNPVASPSVTTKYIVSGTGSNGCINEDTVIVRAGKLPVFFLDSSRQICNGESVKLIASGGDYYQWSPVANIPETDSAIVVRPATNTIYSVVITDTTCAITDSLNTTVTVNALPDLRLQKSTDINCANPTAQLFALSTKGSFYKWFPDSLINDTTVFNPVVHPENDMWYKVEVSTKADCTISDSVLVRVWPQVKGEGYLVPNAFSPNGDGLNDCFKVKYWEPVKNFEISVFDRWGYRVFHSTDVTKCWDGRTNNKQQAPGTYVYQIKAFSTCSNKTIFKKGTLVIIK